MTLNIVQCQVMINLLWDSLKPVPQHPELRQTGWGPKTKAALIECIERIANAEDAMLEHLQALRDAVE